MSCCVSEFLNISLQNPVDTKNPGNQQLEGEVITWKSYSIFFKNRRLLPDLKR